MKFIQSIIIPVAAACILCLVSGCREGLLVKDPAPDKVLREYMLQDEELLFGYEALHPTNFMARMGMNRNPDFIGNVSEVIAVESRGGSMPILGIYGKDDQIRLLVNGIYFEDPEQLESFLAVEKQKDLCMRAYRKAMGDGEWLILYARNPSAPYTEEECRKLEQMVARHAERLHTDFLYCTLWDEHKPES